MAAPESYCSFIGDTMVATAHGEQPIDTIAVGDQVLAYNQQLASTGYYTVTATWAHVDPVIVILRLGGEQIETTPEHPFFTRESGWIAAGSLWQGAHVRRADGGYGQLSALGIQLHPQPMYNLTVAYAHTYFAGLQKWLVHNTCKQLGGTLSNDQEGNRLVDEAVRYHRQLPHQSSVTVGVTSVDGEQIVGINGNAHPDAISRLQEITSAEGVTLVVGSGTPPQLHAEGALYEQYGDTPDLKIGLSNYRGPCPSTCGPYFAEQSNLTGVNIFYPEHFWK